MTALATVTRTGIFLINGHHPAQKCLVAAGGMAIYYVGSAKTMREKIDQGCALCRMLFGDQLRSIGTGYNITSDIGCRCCINLNVCLQEEKNIKNSVFWTK